MIPGKFTVTGCRNLNQKRLFRAEYKNDEKNKLRRKTLRGKRMNKNDKTKEKEGKLYESGGFD